MAASGVDEFNIAPLEQNRGPLIFDSTTVFPNRIDDLMREPTGLVFKVVNFDILDEFGRNLVFTAQEVVDRTVAITIDFGDSVRPVEIYRVSTASDFDEFGLQLGISMRRALEIIGITEAAVDSTDINTYATVIDDTRTDEDGNPLGISVEALFRIRDVSNSTDGTKFWVAISSNTNLDANSNFSSIPLGAHETILLMYTGDEDGDLLFAREEYIYGSLDTNTDTDGDELGDFFEVRTGWSVSKLPGLTYTAFPSPARADSDLDGLEDGAELVLGTDPNRADTDEDGLSDISEVEDTFIVALFDGNADDRDNPILTVTPYSDWVIMAGSDGVCDTTPASDLDMVVTTQTGAGSIICIESGENGVIDTTASGDDEVVATAKIAPGPNGECETTTPIGDDVKEFVTASTPPTKGSLGKMCISAGLNGVLDTDPSGDDFVRVAHLGLFATNPLHHDTDFDGIGDGRELILGVNPNSKDAGAVTDTDGDGLFDNEEDSGWTLAGTSTNVTSNKNRADSDLDGIPDVIERALRSDPRNLDTDGDSLLDYFEFDDASSNLQYDQIALALAFQRCANAPNCNYTPPAAVQLIGTDLTNADTDSDGVNDDVELMRTWTVAVTTPTGSSATLVDSDPLKADEDQDGLDDAEEFALLTHPRIADSDEDGTADGDETVTCLDNGDNEDLCLDSDNCRDPLVADRLIEFNYISFVVVNDCDDPGASGAEVKSSAERPLGFDCPNGVSDTVNIQGVPDDCSAGEGPTLPTTTQLTFTSRFLMTVTDTFRAYTRGNWKECDDAFGNDDLTTFSKLFVSSDVSALTTVTEFSEEITETDDAEGPCKFRFNMTVESQVTPIQ